MSSKIYVTRVRLGETMMKRLALIAIFIFGGALVATAQPSEPRVALGNVALAADVHRGRREACRNRFSNFRNRTACADELRHHHQRRGTSDSAQQSKHSANGKSRTAHCAALGPVNYQSTLGSKAAPRGMM